MSRQDHLLLSILAAGLLLIAACGPPFASSPAATTGEPPAMVVPGVAVVLEGTKWTLTSLRGDKPVAGSFLALALVGSKLGLRAFMAVGLLPFVILTMTIERFFVIMEEAGSREALQTAMGSGAVAAITHGMIHFEPLQLTFFLYPELLLVVAAIQVLLGRYTGYRLSELVRFRALRRST